jgi:hypothetical protein
LLKDPFIRISGGESAAAADPVNALARLGRMPNNVRSQKAKSLSVEMQTGIY